MKPSEQVVHIGRLAMHMQLPAGPESGAFQYSASIPTLGTGRAIRQSVDMHKQSAVPVAKHPHSH